MKNDHCPSWKKQIKQTIERKFQELQTIKNHYKVKCDELNDLDFELNNADTSYLVKMLKSLPQEIPDPEISIVDYSDYEKDNCIELKWKSPTGEIYVEATKFGGILWGVTMDNVKQNGCFLFNGDWPQQVLNFIKQISA